jgi:hypothetical protein
MNNNEYSIIMTRIITLELLPQGNLLKRGISRRLKRGIPEKVNWFNNFMSSCSKKCVLQYIYPF